MFGKCGLLVMTQNRTRCLACCREVSSVSCMCYLRNRLKVFSKGGRCEFMSQGELVSRQHDFQFAVGFARWLWFQLDVRQTSSVEALGLQDWVSWCDACTLLVITFAFLVALLLGSAWQCQLMAL